MIALQKSVFGMVIVLASVMLFVYASPAAEKLDAPETVTESAEDLKTAEFWGWGGGPFGWGGFGWGGGPWGGFWG